MLSTLSNVCIGEYSIILLAPTKPLRSSLVRPATAIVILILLGIIAIAGLIQLWLIYSPPN